MRRVILWVVGVLLLAPVIAVVALLATLNTVAGQGFAERQVAGLLGGTVGLHGFSGRFPDRLRLARVELKDGQGVYAVAEDVALDWSPAALLHRQALVHALGAARVQVMRRPVSEAGAATPAQPSKPFALPLRVTVEQLAVGRVELGAAVLGTAVTASVAAKADLPTLDSGSAEVTILSGGGRYALAGTRGAEGTVADLVVQEPAQGPAATLAGLPDLGPIDLHATVAGPDAALATTLALTAGPLTAKGTAAIDLPGARVQADVTATAPAMTPAPGVSWRAVSLDAHVAGPFTTPDATGQLRIDALEAGGATVQTLVADLSGNAGQARIEARADGLRIPGPSPGLLAGSPLLLTATVRLDDPARPVHVTAAHKLLALDGAARTAGPLTAEARLRLPDLRPLAALGGVEAAGSTDLALKAGLEGGATTLDVDGTLALTAAPAPAPALLGPSARIALSARLAGADVTVTRLAIAGAALTVDASGASRPAGLDVTARIGLSDLALAAPTLTGAAQLDARVRGPLDALALDATLAGDLGAPGVPKAPVRLAAALTGLPGAPTGRITGEGQLAGAPLHLALDAARAPDGTLRATIGRAEWRSLSAEGALTLAPGATLPLGRVALRMTRLDDLRPFIGQPVSGAVTATVQLDPGAIVLDAEARNAGVPGSQVGHAVLKARVADPLGAPSVNAALAADGIAAAGVTGTAKVEAAGPQTALAIRTTARINASGTDAQVTGAALLDAAGKSLRLDALQVMASTASVRNETVRLLAPATIRFAGPVTVDRLRLGVRQATLDVAGRLSPTLDATVALRAPADIAAMFGPELAADGTVALDARLGGAPARPTGTAKLTATGLRMRTGPGRAAPPANLVANVQLGGTTARVDATVTAGSAQLAVNGTAPLGPGALNLRATGGLDLALLDPVLAADGRRARGRVTLDAAVTGTAATPALVGTATLANGEIQDFGQGVRLTALAGTLRAEGQTLRIVSMTGRAGSGTVSLGGSIGVLAPSIPVDLVVALRNARPLASDVITADLDADLTVRGAVATGLQAGGRVLVRRAELNVPKTLPASVVTLNVRRPGDKPRAPAAAGAPVALDLVIEAPNAVFLRGRGIDAEMAGSLRIRGTSTAPQVGGGLEMRRGTISVAGTTLNFSRGKIGFDGTGVTGKIDPTLDFAADSTAGGVTATLAITGYVSKPVIRLSSVPDLPQDEVLAYLIFKRSAKELGPFQIAEIAAAVAELTGVGGGGGLNPLESVRRGLGLDRLSVGAGTGSSSTPTVEAGRYVANGVYVGAKQGTTGGQTQATVQIDITKGLKLQTDVGTGQGGNSVGLTYQFEY